MNYQNAEIRVLAWPRKTADNPYVELLYQALSAEGIVAREFSIRDALFGRYDAVHVHWPEGIISGRGAISAVIASSAQFVVLGWARHVRRKTVLWTVHNLKPHAVAPRLGELVVYAGLRASISASICLSEFSRSEANRVFPWLAGRPQIVSLHGRYGASLQSEPDRSEIRTGLGVSENEFLIAFVGRMEPYKGPDLLADAFDASLSSGTVRLLFAGRIPASAYGEELRATLSRVGAIVEDSQLSDERFADLVRAADLVVYPYRRILNSGSILMPLEYGTPVLSPAEGSIPEMASLIGEDWLRTYERPLTAKVLAAGVARPASGSPNLEVLDWGVIARSLARFIRQLVRA